MRTERYEDPARVCEREPVPERTICVKDPAMKGSVYYTIPLCKVRSTKGLSAYLASTPSGSASSTVCLCKLWVEQRCRQGYRCKSIHVDRDRVLSERESSGAEKDDRFINEVAVTAGGHTFALGFNAVTRTKGLDQFREMYHSVGDSTDPLRPILLCTTNPDCPLGRSCPRLHIKSSPGLLEECRNRTPCCLLHGDAEVTKQVPGDFVVELTLSSPGATVTHTIPKHRVALTSWLLRHADGHVKATSADLCLVHTRSRCKFGRSCEKLHICRCWSKSVLHRQPQVDSQSTAAACDTTASPASPTTQTVVQAIVPQRIVPVLPCYQNPWPVGQTYPQPVGILCATSVPCAPGVQCAPCAPSVPCAAAPAMQGVPCASSVQCAAGVPCPPSVHVPVAVPRAIPVV